MEMRGGWVFGRLVGIVSSRGTRCDLGLSLFIGCFLVRWKFSAEKVKCEAEVEGRMKEEEEQQQEDDNIVRDI